MSKVEKSVTGTVVEGGAVKGDGERGYAYQDTSTTVLPGVPLYADCGSGVDSEVGSNLQKFVSQGYQDVWAAVLFVAAVVVTIGFGAANFQSNLDYVHTHQASVATTTDANGKSHSNVQVDTVEDDGHGVSGKTILLGALGITMAAVAGATIILLVLAAYPRKAIIYTNVAVTVIYLLLAFYLFAQGAVWGGIICLICAPLNLLWLYLVRSRIPFAALLLKIATKLMMRYKSTMVISVLSVLVFYVYSIFNLSMSFPMIHRIGEKQAESGDVAMYLVCMLFYFWVAQVCMNVVHVTVAGLVATWYFVGDDHMPPNPTTASFKRAMTTSFGSICFGSLLVAIIQTMRKACDLFADHENDFVRCIVQCILSILEALLEYFNTYAFIHCAIYGVSYIDGAKRTWALAKECGWKTYFNDCLIEPTISLTSLAMGAFMGGFAWLVTGNAVVGITTFIAVLLICLMVLRVIESAVPTIFVCYAEVPSALLQSNAELYNLMHSADYASTSASVV